MKTTHQKVMSMTNTRALQYKYFGPTNHKGARIKIIDKWYEKSITIPFSYEYSTASENAIAYLMDRGWSVSGMNTEIQVIFMSEWNTQKQLK